MRRPLYKQLPSQNDNWDLLVRSDVFAGLSRSLLTAADYADFFARWYPANDALTRYLLISAGRLTRDLEWLRRFFIDAIDHYDKCSKLLLDDFACCGGDSFVLSETSSGLWRNRLEWFMRTEAQRHNPVGMLGLIVVLQDIALSRFPSIVEGAEQSSAGAVPTCYFMREEQWHVSRKAQLDSILCGLSDAQTKQVQRVAETARLELARFLDELRRPRQSKSFRCLEEQAHYRGRVG